MSARVSILEDLVGRMEREIEELREQLAGIPLRLATGGGGGGSEIPTVEVLPDIPSTGFKIVFWTSEGAGTGDNRLWFAAVGDTQWGMLPLLYQAATRAALPAGSNFALGETTGTNKYAYMRPSGTWKGSTDTESTI